jgi:hypothetical protein
VKFLRAIVGKTRRERIRNTYIRGQLKMEEIQNQIEESRLRWLVGYVKKKDKHRILKIFLEMKMSGRRQRGRPCMQLIDQVKRNGEKRG